MEKTIDEITVQRRYKSYDKRTLVIYQNGKPIDYVRPFYGWYAGSNICPETRKLVMENLHWLLGHDCDYDEWKDEYIEMWDRARRIYGVPITESYPESLFFNNEEKERALKSFYNYD